MSQRDFAKIFRREDNTQVLVTNLYDASEDCYIVKIAYESNTFGECFMENKMFFAEEQQANDAFDQIESLDDIKEMCR